MDIKQLNDLGIFDSGRLERNVDSREKKSQKSHNLTAGAISVYATIIAPIFEAMILGFLSYTKPSFDLSSITTMEQLKVTIESQGIWNAINDQNNMVLYVFLFVVVITHFIAAMINIVNQQRYSHYFAYKEINTNYKLLVNEYDSLRGKTKSILASRLALDVSVANLEEIIAKIRTTSTSESISIQEFLVPVLAPFIHQREEIFGYKGESLYNFAIYRYNPEKSLLELGYRDCDKRIKTQNRTWRPGQGHVGLTFIQKELKICNNAEASTELASSPQDNKYYMSFASAPILFPEDTPKTESPALGVLVITSSYPDQFNVDIVARPIMTLSRLLGIVMHEVRNHIELSSSQGDSSVK